MKKLKAFTLVELLVTVAVIGILTTIGIASYQNVVEKSKAKVCAQNIKMLTTAVKMYSLENDSLPASLSQVPVETYRRAYAQVIKKGPIAQRFARAIVKDADRNIAWAIQFNQDNFINYGTSVEAWYCPSDTSGNQSYAINQNLQGKKWQLIEKHLPQTPIVGERTGYRVFTHVSQLSGRHKVGNALNAQYGTASGTVINGDSSQMMPDCVFKSIPSGQDPFADMNEVQKDYHDACKGKRTR